MDTFLKDIRYGFRMLLRNPGVSAVALLAITLGIGINTTVFSGVDATLFHPFSFANQQRLVMVWESNRELGFSRSSVAPGNYADWSEQNQTLERIVGINQRSFDLASDNDQPERFGGYEVARDFFEVLGVKPLYGRTFLPEESQQGRDHVVVLKHSLWERRFGADPEVVGKLITLNRKSFTVVGVMPADFNFPFNGGELWAPLTLDSKTASDRASHYMQVLAMLKPGITIDQAREDLNSIARRQQEQFPDTNAGRGVNVVTMTSDAVRGSRMYAPITLAAVGFVLLIACANVATLLLVRGASRQKEIAIRMAMGATRWRLIRQLLTESLLLSLVGGALGLLVSVWGIEALARMVPADYSKFIPGWQYLRINQTALLFTIAASLLSGLLFGLVPAIQATKASFNETLKEGGKGTSSLGARNRARSTMVVAEVALSLVLLIGAGLMIRSFIEILQADLGIDPNNVLSVQVSLSDQKYEKFDARTDFYNRLVNGIASEPSVTAVGGTGILPMGGDDNRRAIRSIGQTVFAQSKQPLVNYSPITIGYLEAMGTRLIKGRNFVDHDRSDTQRVCLVDEAFAREFLPGRDALGEEIKDIDAPALQIVGLVASVMDEDMEERLEPHIYVPYAQDSWRTLNLVIRSTTDPSSLADAVRNQVAAIDKTLPVSRVKAMNQVISERRSPKRLVTFLFGTFAIIALLLAAIGLYAVMSFSVSQRTNEIGIRMALGARPRDIFRLVVGHGVALTLAGVGIGLAGAFAMTRAMTGLLYGISVTDPLTYLGISLLLGGVAILACYVPTRKATQVDPMVALRHE